jgi:hypothetical protein
MRDAAAKFKGPRNQLVRRNSCMAREEGAQNKRRLLATSKNVEHVKGTSFRLHQAQLLDCLCPNSTVGHAVLVEQPILYTDTH